MKYQMVFTPGEKQSFLSLAIEIREKNTEEKRSVHRTCESLSKADCQQVLSLDLSQQGL